MSEPRRWTLVEGQGGYEHGYSESEGSLGPGESIEVVEATRESELEDRCMDLHLETERLISERDRETDLRREAEAEVERLREALTPFALLAQHADRLRHSDDSTAEWRLRAADIRAARDALSLSESGGYVKHDVWC